MTAGTAVGRRETVLSIEGLSVEFQTTTASSTAVDQVSLDVAAGEILGVVGESGSGKSVTMLATLGLLPTPPARVVNGRAMFKGENLLTMRPKDLRKIRGHDIGFVFQDPGTSFNPVMTIGAHLAEALTLHGDGIPRREVRDRSVELLRRVGIPDPADRLGRFPHELSGGMRQRVMIAIAIANDPSLIIADEPTTALDVTIQAEILDVLRAAQRDTSAATILITHDLGVIAEVADRVAVFYAGRVAEVATVDELFHEPRHPYTRALLNSRPLLRGGSDRLELIPGQPPGPYASHSGCPYRARCTLTQGRPECAVVPGLLPLTDGHLSACHFASELASQPVPGGAA
jgi:oligopeptide transport system ATP-binding protein